MSSLSDAELAAWYADRDAERVLLLDLVVAEDDAEETHYFASRSYRSGTLAYLNRIASRPYIDRELGALPTVSSLELFNTDGALETLISRELDVRRVWLRLGAPEWTIGQFATVHDGGGFALRSRSSGKLIVVEVKGSERVLAVPVQPNIVTSGPSANAKRPRVYGEVYNFEPPLVDESSHTYALNDGPIQLILNVRSRSGVLFTAGADYSTSQANLDAGNLVMTADPGGNPLVDFRASTGTGINGPAASVHWLQTPGDILADLLTRTGSYEQGLAQGGGASTIQLSELASDVDDYYNGATVRLVAGAGEGESDTITDYVGLTRTATVSGSWGTQPDTTTFYEVDIETALGPVEFEDLETAGFNGLGGNKLGFVATELTVAEAVEKVLASHTAYLTLRRDGLVRVHDLAAPSGPGALTLRPGDYFEDSLEVESDECLAWRVRIFAIANQTPLREVDNSLAEETVLTLSRAFRHIAQAPDYGVKRNYAGREPLDLAICSVIADADEADDEAAAQLALRKVPHKFYQVRARSGPFQLEPGDEYMLEAGTHGLSGGKALVAWRIRDLLLDNEVILRGWG